MVKNKNIKKSIKLVSILTIGLTSQSFANPIALSDVPLFLSTKATPNVMILYGNSNSMDSREDGTAAGSGNSDSKSEVTRTAVKSLISNYQGRVNMGLMGYAQTNIEIKDLSTAYYDVSYNQSHYNPSWNGDVTSRNNKKFRTTNLSQTQNYLYYNVALPGYSSVSARSKDNIFCFTTNVRSKAFSNNERIVNNNVYASGSGPWNSYDCYQRKTGQINAGPTAAAADNRADTTSASAAGYSVASMTGVTFVPTDSDLALGITNFGNQIAQQYVAPAWFSYLSPGYGFVHLPIALLDNTQVAKMNTKLGTSQFTVANTEKNANYPLVNAGLSPIAGSINTASSYFAGTLNNANQGGRFSAPPNSCNQDFLVMLTDGLPSVLANGTVSSDTTALLNDFTNSVRNIRTNRKVTSYIVGFAMPHGAHDDQLVEIAKAGGTGQPYYAENPNELSTTLHNVFTDIMNRTSASSAVALNAGYVSSNDRVYQARFNSSDWSGDLISVSIDSSGNLPANFLESANWKAGTQITAQTPGSRVILTTKASTRGGVAFRWNTSSNPGASQLDRAQLALLSVNPDSGNLDSEGSNRLNYLRGVRTLESSSFRYRSSVLGDIINSAPVMVRAPNANYTETDYLTFRENQKNRIPVIYVGANDGMLHGFNANTGNAIVSYVPTPLFGNLNRLTSRNYSHKYYVDGNPASADVKYADGSWKTVLVSGMGNGAKGIFGLDITNPSSFSEANASTIVNFEYTSTDDADIGHIQGAPSIVKLNNGKWAAIFGNGWNNSGSGQSALFIVDVQTGALIKKIRTGSGTSSALNGLATPTPIDIDNNGTIDYVYAGDLNGNMWKFDISGSDPANWGVALSGRALFAAGTTKPITTQPEVTLSPYGGYMVLFGTGRYLQSTDLTSTSTQTFYGIWDNNAVVAANQLRQQSVNQQTEEFRRTSEDVVNYPTQKGWFMNLPVSGERSVSDPLLTSGNIFFSTLIPSNTTCSAGGVSWLMGLNYLNGTLNTNAIFDSNKDGKVNTDDVSYSGMKLASISSSPTLLKGLGKPDDPLQELFFNLSSGDVAGVFIKSDNVSSRRTSWRNIIKR